jgi:hypothetical protein
MGWQVMAMSKKRTLTPLPLNVNPGSSWTQMKSVLLTFLLRIREMVSPVNITLFFPSESRYPRGDRGGGGGGGGRRGG